jgi:ABC-type sugar transport system permease subunit
VPRQGDTAEGGQTDPRPFGSGNCVDLRCAHHRPAAGGQHLSADLDHLGSASRTSASTGRTDVEFIGLRNYERILTDSDIWMTMQATAHFLFWTLCLQVLIGFALAWLINRKFKGNDLWTTIIVLPMMLSPAVVGNFWTFLYQPQIGLFNYVIAFFTGADPTSFSMIGDVHLAPGRS